MPALPILSSNGDSALAGRTLVALVAATAAAMLAIRLWVFPGQPLWLDETWTAMIATQDSWSGFLREAWLDCNPPLYYALVGLWTEVAGQSNLALRFPSLAFSLLAPLAILLARIPGLSREARLTWASLLLCWWPAMAMALDARGYALLLFLSTLQGIAFIGLLHRPDMRSACLWSGFGALAILTHYHSGFLVATQAATFAVLRRQSLPRLLPALLLFVPAAAWLALHLPRLLAYARPDVAWYEPVGPLAMGAMTAHVFGVRTGLFILCAVAVFSVAIVMARRGVRLPRDEECTHESSLWPAALSAVAALALLLALGAVKASLTARYLTPIVPLALLVPVLAVRRASGSHWSYAGIVAVYLCGSLTPWSLHDRLEARAAYGHERASQFLARHDVRKLVFAWDHPASKILDPGSLDRLGGYFFERSGMAVPVTSLRLRPGQDPNARLAKTAVRPGDSILWIYNLNRDSAAAQYRPKLQFDRRWTCHHQVRGPIGILACVRAATLPAA